MFLVQVTCSYFKHTHNNIRYIFKRYFFFLKGKKILTFMQNRAKTYWTSDWPNWCYLSTHTRDFTVQGRDDSREGSASSVPCPEPETLPRGQASVSTPLQSTTDSPSLEKAPPTTATPATPAPEQGSLSLGLFSGAEPAQSGAGSAEAVVDDVFSMAEEVLSAPDSPHKEFHCAVLRALSKEPSVVEASKADQAPGTPDEAESCLQIWPSASLLPCSALARLTTCRCTGSVGTPACCVLSFFWGFGVCCRCFTTHRHPPNPQFNLQSLCLIIFFPHPSPLSLMSCSKPSEFWQIRYRSAVWLDVELSRGGCVRSKSSFGDSKPPPLFEGALSLSVKVLCGGVLC